MFSYQNLEGYKKAFLVNQSVYRFLKEKTTIPAYAKKSIGRASLSIVLNIAEGSAKFTKKDRKNFYVISRASVCECAALIEILFAENEIPIELKKVLEEGFNEISRMLYAMIKNLEQS